MGRDKKIDYLTKYLCIGCCKTLKRPVEGPGLRVCAHCGGPSVRMGQKFKPPKLGDNKAWDVVLYLIEKGFRYDSIYAQDEKGDFIWNSEAGHFQTAQYPVTMIEAQEFVIKYQKWSEPFEQAIFRNHKVGR